MKKTILLLITIVSITLNAQVVVRGVSPSVDGMSFDFTWADPTVAANGWSTPDFNQPNTFVQDTLMLVTDTSHTGNNPAYAIPHPLANEGCLTTSGDQYSQPNLAGKIAVVWRGSCQFGLKAAIAENNGAVGIIIINHSGAPVGMAGGDSGMVLNIPVVMISTSDGQFLLNEMLNGPVELFMGNKMGSQINDVGSSVEVANRAKYGSIPIDMANNGFTFDLGLTVTNFGQDDNFPILDQTINGPSGEIYSSNLNLGLTAPFTSVDTLYETVSYSGYDVGEYTIDYNLSILSDTTFSVVIDSIVQTDSLIQDTTYNSIVDTIVLTDSIYNIGTNITTIIDTIILTDSIYNIGTNITTIIDTIIQTDSLVQDTIITPIDTTYIDTTFSLVDTLFTTDTTFIDTTVTLIDTLFTTDTLLIDTTVTLIDTLFTTDTLFINTTITLSDTLFTTDTLLTEFDQDLADNHVSSTFNVTNDVLSLARTDENTGELVANYFPSTVFNNSYKSCMALMDSFPTGGYGVEGIYFAMAKPDSTVGSEYIQVEFYEWDDPFGSISAVGGFAGVTFQELNYIKLHDYVCDDDSLNRKVLYTQFDSPVTLSDGQRYLVCLSTENSDVSFGYDNDANYSSNYAYYDQPVGALNVDLAWYSGWNSADAPAIGLKTGDFTGIIENNNIEGTLFPNPTNTDFKLNFSNVSGPANILIFDVAGRLAKTISVNNIESSNRFDVTYLNDGHYFVKVSFENGKTSNFNLIINK